VKKRKEIRCGLCFERRREIEQGLYCACGKLILIIMSEWCIGRNF
jgi:hypothetical protein